MLDACTVSPPSRLDLWSANIDNTAVADKGGKPDYELEEILEVSRPEQFRAVGDPLRLRVIGLLSERAATTSQLAETLGESKGNVGHHLKILEGAGLVRVVRTRKVRAITEKYYGRTARAFKFSESGAGSPGPFLFYRQAMDEHAGSGARRPPGFPEDLATLRHARVPAGWAKEFADRVLELAEEFARMEAVPGEKVYGFVAGVFLTDLPELPEDGE